MVFGVERGIGGQLAEVVKKCAKTGQLVSTHCRNTLQHLDGVAQQIALRVMLERSCRNLRHQEQFREKFSPDVELDHALEKLLRRFTCQSFQHLVAETLDRHAAEGG